MLLDVFLFKFSCILFTRHVYRQSDIFSYLTDKGYSEFLLDFLKRVITAIICLVCAINF